MNYLKELLALGICVFLCSFNTNAQTTRRVNGDPNITGVNVYNTIQAAVDAANTDDVILIEPWGGSLSTTYQEAVTIDKRLHLRGNGYNLDNPGLQPKPLDSRTVDILGVVTFSTGSAGSTFRNLSVSTGNFGFGLYVGDSNIRIENCLLAVVYITSYGIPNTNQYTDGGTGLVLKKSIILGATAFGLRGVVDNRVNSATISTSLILENCWIIGTLGSSAGNFIRNSVIKNCNLRFPFIRLSNCTITNCVIDNSIRSFEDSNNLSISHSASVSGDLPSSNGNINNIDLSTFYTNGPTTYITSFQGEIDQQLSPTSVGIGAGVNGEDIGMYGGADPYQFSGLPNSPISEFFNNSGVGNNTTNISATATFKAN
jgi:hypothetical protein